MDKKLINILICPKTLKPLKLHPSKNFLVCFDEGIAYPIINGVPHLLETAAVPISSLAETEVSLNSEQKQN
ncbi:MAG: hypothetical protein CBD16_04440 [Betaproteobacteria bacterium TMED156]|nr:MAG: hypothetical protein CBD16_04440 [Betaproteobacteria bacterium TMED156]|tara:strand:- start:1750 stop:1962 length:213 start_codon:yes stop_codon:yes gene_type:complete